ncbi:hypothetical protein OG921_00405 [Aldersonia sp. NBC_00410]|uniref:hypothetical protein n=1 Tax=Aldersonia sp. NBC_00410 TaxID=2975954 RepID=UPI002251828B|nr:hypothetical protein [Aldersonia sp. NBC_00410]MCX5041653.1 hypothetical protein [Aldersonia sp. NBC_00410]
MPPNRRVNQPGPARRRPKIAGTGRSIAPQPPEQTPSPAPQGAAEVPVQQAPTRPQAAPAVEAAVEAAPTPETRPAPAPEPAAPTAQPEAVGFAEPPADVAPRAADAPRRRRDPLQLAALGFVVLLVLIGIATVAGKFALDRSISNQAYVDTAATEEVKAAAENALTTITAYKFDDMDGWADRSHQVLNEKMQGEFDKTVEVTKSAAQQSKTSTETKIDPTGVTLIDGDHAEVLAFMNVSVTNDGVAQGSSSGPQLARMEKVDGKWLLADIVLD